MDFIIGSTNLANGFYTDQAGNGSFAITLDFLLTDDGVDPFDPFDPSLSAVPFGRSPFRIRLASHCDRGNGHGQVPSRHEVWFDTQSFAVIPEPTTMAMSAIGLVGLPMQQKVMAGRRRPFALRP